eukprot:6142407-Alexandrium_andersonii.AAC.1
MSASLVGSEMCIRDSFWTRRALSLPFSPRNDWLSASQRIVMVLLGLRPVSYTHLTLPTICSV